MLDLLASISTGGWITLAVLAGSVVLFIGGWLAPEITGLLAAALLLFVEVMKELPATLVMRPFNYDTLAVQAYNLAADERLAEASTPALTIVAVGLLPLILLSRMMLKGTPGSEGSRAPGS